MTTKRSSSLPDATETGDGLPLQLVGGRFEGAEHPRAGEAELLQRLAEQPGLEPLEVDDDVGELGHGGRMADGRRQMAE